MGWLGGNCSVVLQSRPQKVSLQLLSDSIGGNQVGDKHLPLEVEKRVISLSLIITDKDIYRQFTVIVKEISEVSGSQKTKKRLQRNKRPSLRGFCDES